MRNLALKVLTGGIEAGFDVLNDVTDERVVPFACELVGVVYDISAAPTNVHSADVLVNGAEIAVTTVDIDFPAVITQGLATPDRQVFLAAGDRINLRSNGENASPDAYGITLSYIFKPLSSRPAGEVWLDGEAFADIDTAAASQAKCLPFDCEISLVAFGMSAATNAEIDVGIFLNDADTTIDIVIPTATANAVLRPVGGVFAAMGDSIHLNSDGAGSAGGLTAITYVCSPKSTKVPVDWVYLPFTGGIAFQTAAQEYVDVVAPCDGKVRDLVTHWPIDPDAISTFDLEVNAATPTGTPIFSVGINPLNDVGFSSPITNMHDVYVKRGDLITVVCNGEQIATTANGTAGIWIEPMGGAAGVGL